MRTIDTSEERLESLIVAALTRLRGDAGAGGDGVRSVAWSLVHLGLVALYTGESAAARDRFVESAARFRETADVMGRAIALFLQGDATVADDRLAARALYEESLAVGRAAADAYLIAYPLTSLGRMALDDGDYATARALYEEGLAARRQVGEQWTIAVSLASLGDVARCEGDFERAATLFAEGQTLSQEIGDMPRQAWLLCGLGFVALHQRDLRQARARLAEALGLAQALGHTPRIAVCLLGLAAAAATDRPEHAARLFGAVAALGDAAGVALDPADRIDFDRSVDRVRAILGDVAFAAAWAVGRAPSLEHAIAAALETVAAAGA